MAELPWRVGRSFGFTIYEQIGERPSKDDRPLMVALGPLDDARRVAAEVVKMRDGYLRSLEARK